MKTKKLKIWHSLLEIADVGWFNITQSRIENIECLFFDKK